MVIITFIEVIIMAGLLSLLEKEASARLVFGKRELKIVEKQLRGVRLTQSEKNRLSRSVRRKLEFIRRAARFEDEFELKKGAELRRQVDEVLDLIKNDEAFNKIRRIWLYGSAATGEITLSSDVDFAVDLVGANKREAAEFRSRVLGNAGVNIDVQVFETLPNEVREEITKTGRVLYERKAGE